MLLGAFIQHDMLDELPDVAPYLAGGLARRIATGPVQVLTHRCAHILTDDAGYLYTRYVKDGRAGEAGTDGYRGRHQSADHLRHRPGSGGRR